MSSPYLRLGRKALIKSRRQLHRSSTQLVPTCHAHGTVAVHRALPIALQEWLIHSQGSGTAAEALPSRWKRTGHCGYPSSDCRRLQLRTDWIRAASHHTTKQCCRTSSCRRNNARGDKEMQTLVRSRSRVLYRWETCNPRRKQEQKSIEMCTKAPETKKQKGNFLELSCGVLMEIAYHILKNSEDWFRVVPL